MTIYDDADKLLRTDQFYMDPLAHRAFVLKHEYPETEGKIGYVKFTTDGLGGIAGIGLRFSPNETFTSMHLIAVD